MADLEVEAKYTVLPADLDLVAELTHLGPYTLRHAAAPEIQQNTYFDTADGRLSQSRHGLRVRRVGERSRITLKGPAETLADGLSRRVEYEFPGDDLDPQRWPAGPARELGLRLVGAIPLAPTVTIATARRIAHVERAGTPIAEIALDQGTINAGARQAPICELEIELHGAGTLADIAQIAAALRALITLTPEPRSKLTRALALRSAGDASADNTHRDSV